MITELILKALHGFAVGLFGWLSSVLPAAPAFWADMMGAFENVLDAVPGPVLWFVPVGPALAAVGALLALIVALGLLRLARRVISLITGGGGNA